MYFFKYISILTKRRFKIKISVSLHLSCHPSCKGEGAYMERDLLLVIDMQNVYGSGGAWCCPKAETAAANIKRLIETCDGDLQVIFTRFLASDEPYGAWADYNRENAAINADPKANEMMDIFKEDLNKYPLYTKSVYSSLKIPEIERAAKEAPHVLLSGVVAECCVLSTAMELIDLGAHVIYLKDAAAGLDEVNEKAVETVLSGLAPLHVEIMSCEDYKRRCKGGQE